MPAPGRKKTFKLVMIGESGVGKTSFIRLYVHRNRYDIDTGPTIGAAFFTQQVEITENNQNIRAQLNIWDTAGQELYRSLIPVYYRDTQIAIVMYDITSRNSFKTAEHWLEKIRETVPCIALVGNKTDTVLSRTVSLKEGKKLAEDYGTSFYEISVKNCSDNSIFDPLVKIINDCVIYTHDNVPQEDDNFYQRGVNLGSGSKTNYEYSLNYEPSEYVMFKKSGCC